MTCFISKVDQRLEDMQKTPVKLQPIMKYEPRLSGWAPSPKWKTHCKQKDALDIVSFYSPRIFDYYYYYSKLLRNNDKFQSFFANSCTANFKIAISLKNFYFQKNLMFEFKYILCEFCKFKSWNFETPRSVFPRKFVFAQPISCR